MLKAVAGLGLLTLVEKGMAAARQVLLAALFGAGAAMDGFIAALSVAEIVVALTTGSFIAVFVPLYAGWKQEHGKAAADARSVSLVLAVGALLLGAASLVYLLGDRAAALVGYGFSAEQHALSASLMPWLAIFVAASGAGAMLTGLYQVRGRFLAPPLAQIGERAVVLGGLILLAPRLGIRAAAVTAAVGGLVGAALLGAAALRRVTPPRPEIAPALADLRVYSVLFLPLLFAALVDQAVLLTDRSMASVLGVGAVSILYYAGMLWRIPATLLCANFATVLFPRLAEDLAAGEPRRLRDSLSFAMRAMILVTLPATALLIALSREVTSLVLVRGRFDAAAAGPTALALAALSLCLVFEGVGTVVNITLYAARRMGAVAACGVGRVVLNAAFNALLMRRYGVTGIALSTSLTLGLWFLIASVPFRRELARRGVPRLLDRSLAGLIGKGLAASGLAGGAAWLASAAVWPHGEGMVMRILALAGASLAGLAVYGAALLLLRLPEAQALLARLFPGPHRAERVAG
jgi:putative peptidoglycan lipid II flippase